MERKWKNWRSGKNRKGRETRKIWKGLAGLLLAVALVAGTGMNALAAQERIEDCLVYYADEMSWDNRQVYIAGYVYNDSSTYDIFGMEDVELVVYDSEGTFVFSVLLDDDETGEIVLSPGGVCPFNVTVSGRLNDSDYELEDGFYADISAVFSYAECGGKKCKRCGGTQQLGMGTGTGSGSGAGTGTGTGYVPDIDAWSDYSWDYGWDIGGTPTYETICSKCGGTGRVMCTTCNGTGYMTTTKYSINLGSGSTPYEQKIRCGCDNGYYSCILCGGDGKY